MKIDLAGKRALVCGSTQGIGWAAARQLADCGAEVVLLARNEESLQKRLTELPTPNQQSHQYLCADFRKPGQVEQVVLAYLRESAPIHILINNTGGPPGGPAVEATPEAYLEAFRQHLICNQILASALSEGMKQIGYGRIVNIISTSVKQPIAGLGVSNTIRGATASWAKTISRELAPYGITVNNVLPGATRTERLYSIMENRAKNTGASVEQVEAAFLDAIPAGRFAEPEEVAAAAVFLASPLAGYINGVSLAVDGGRTQCL